MPHLALLLLQQPFLSNPHARHVSLYICFSVMQIANPSVGIVDIQYRRVDCQPPANMNIDVTNWSGAGGWLRLTVQVSDPAWPYPSTLATLPEVDVLYLRADAMRSA